MNLKDKINLIIIFLFAIYVVLLLTWLKPCHAGIDMRNLSSDFQKLENELKNIKYNIMLEDYASLPSSHEKLLNLLNLDRRLITRPRKEVSKQYILKAVEGIISSDIRNEVSSRLMQMFAHKIGMVFYYEEIGDREAESKLVDEILEELEKYKNTGSTFKTGCTITRIPIEEYNRR